MTYTEFRKAAFRHLNTCECLIANMDSDDCKKSKNDILINIFYLSGYVIECSLKYVLFSQVRYNSNEDVYQYKCGVCKGCLKGDECSEWKHHNIDKLKNVLEEKGVKFSSDIPILGSKHKISGNIVKLFNERNDPKMQIRYSYYNSSLTRELITEYLFTIKEMNKKLINKF